MVKAGLKHIVILATGGTIAGRAASALTMTGYKAGALSAGELLGSVPGLNELAEITVEQLCNIDSRDMTDSIMLKIAGRVDKLLAEADVDGIVITHGTDTMEETAYFLQLAVKSDKPVVLTGAMRPATALSADGPLNLYNAVKTAADEGSRSFGVLIVMNDEIYSAESAVKFDSASVAAFAAPCGGPLGRIVGGRPHFFYRPPGPGGLRGNFAAEMRAAFGRSAAGKEPALPRVDIIYAHSGDDRLLIDAAVAAGAGGLVYAGSGMGSISQAAEAGLMDAGRQGIAVVRASRVSAGFVAAADAKWTRAGFLNSGRLNPQKARLLLQLVLTRTTVTAFIQSLFDKA